MILGEPTFETIIEIIDAEGCPRCGELPMEIFIDGPSDVELSCGHTVDVKRLLDPE